MREPKNESKNEIYAMRVKCTLFACGQFVRLGILSQLVSLHFDLVLVLCKNHSQFKENIRKKTFELSYRKKKKFS